MANYAIELAPRDFAVHHIFGLNCNIFAVCTFADTTQRSEVPMKLIMYSVLASLAIMLIGCIQPMQLNAQPMQSNKVRYVAITTGFPIISTSVNGAKQDVVIYITPSCPVCIRLYNALVLQDLVNSVSLERANISFVVVPRFDYDHEVIKNLFCVEHQKVFTSVSKFFGSALQIASSQRGFEREESLISLSADTARSFGVPDSALAMCQENNKFDSTIRAVWEHGWRRNPEQEWPLVVINDHSTNIKNMAALVEALRE